MQRRTVVQIVDSVPVVPILFTFVPWMVDQLAEVPKIFDYSLPDVEQVIEEPEIMLDQVPHRTLLLEPQLLDQLVDVPVPLSVSLERRHDADGHLRHQVVMRRGGGCWWRVGARLVQWLSPCFDRSSL